jgi:hypothetical protein
VLHFLIWSIRIVSGLFGALLLYAALFLYEDEQRQVHNTLEAWWVRLDDIKERVPGQHTRFLRGLAMTCQNALDFLFGRGLVSLDSLAVSVSLSLASIGLAVVGQLFYNVRIKGQGLAQQFPGRPITGMLVLAAWVAGFSTLALCRPRIELWPILRISMSVGLAIAVFWYFELPYFAVGMAVTTGAGILVGSLLLTYVWLVSFRWLIARLSSATTQGAIIVSALTSALLCAVLAAPYVASHWLVRHLDPILFDPASGLLMQVVVFNALAASNVPAMLGCVVIVLAALALTVHRLMWPALQRPVYALAKADVIRRPKALAAVGLALLGSASTGLHGLQRVIQWVAALAKLLGA